MEFAETTNESFVSDETATAGSKSLLFQSCHGNGSIGPVDSLSVSALHPIVESCLRDQKADGNIWSGGLGVGVYLRIKLSGTETDGRCHRYLHLHNALTLLWSSMVRTESESSPESEPKKLLSSDRSSSHLGLLSNAFVGSRCLLVSLLVRLGRNDEASEVAVSVLGQLSDLYETANTTQQDNCDCSILFGLAGALQVIWFLRKELGEPTLGRELALTFSYTILLEGLQHPNERTKITGNSDSCNNDDDNDDDATNHPRLMWKWNGWPYLGTGTGSVGILYALMGHTDDEWEDLGDCLPNAKSVAAAAIDDLANHRYENPDSFSGRGNLRDAAPMEFDPPHEQFAFEFDAAHEKAENHSSCNWNHGAPGYCLLLLKAFDVYGDERFFFHARDLADSVLWARWQQQKQHQCSSSSSSKTGGTTKLLGLAKGAPGIAYVFLAMARVDWKDCDLWKDRARELARFALRTSSELGGDEGPAATTDRPKSLFDGIGGLASLLIDLEGKKGTTTTTDDGSQQQQQQQHHYFPFFESCQANPNPRKLEYKTRPEDHYFFVVRNKRDEDIKAFAKSPAMTTGRSTAETAPTQALTTTTTSVTTQNQIQLQLQTMTTTTRIRNHNNGCGIDSTNHLDVSQLTEPSVLASATQLRLIASTSPQPTISETIDAIAAPKPVFTATKPTKAERRCMSRTSMSFDRATQSFEARTKSSMTMIRRSSTTSSSSANHLQKNHSDSKAAATVDDDDNSAFMTDSVKRIQRAEASWIHHFGGQHQKEKRTPSRRRQLGISTMGSPGAAAAAVTTRSNSSGSFRRTVGAFSGLPDAL